MFSHTSVSFLYEKAPFWRRCQTFGTVRNLKVQTFSDQAPSHFCQSQRWTIQHHYVAWKFQRKQWFFWLWSPASALDRKVGAAEHLLSHKRIAEKGKEAQELCFMYFMFATYPVDLSLSFLIMAVPPKSRQKKRVLEPTIKMKYPT